MPFSDLASMEGNSIRDTQVNSKKQDSTIYKETTFEYILLVDLLNAQAVSRWANFTWFTATTSFFFFLCYSPTPHSFYVSTASSIRTSLSTQDFSCNFTLAARFLINLLVMLHTSETLATPTSSAPIRG
jgi:hypothetical protein